MSSEHTTPQAVLVEVAGKHVGRQICLDDIPRVRLGGIARGESGWQSVVIEDDDTVCDLHARIVHLNGVWHLIDSSQGGTVVNDVAIGIDYADDSRARLESGDRVRIGGTIFEFRTGDTAQAAVSVLSELAITDTATRAATLSHFETTLKAELTRAHHYRTPLTVVAVDVSRFSQTSERHGARVSDRALADVVDQVKGVLLPFETVARYAGDVFLAIVPQRDPAEVEQLMKDLRTAVAEFPFNYLNPEEQLSIRACAGTPDSPYTVRRFLEGLVDDLKTRTECKDSFSTLDDVDLADLRNLLAGCCQDRDIIRQMLTEGGLQMERLDLIGSPIVVWERALRLASRTQALESVIGVFMASEDFAGVRRHLCGIVYRA